MLKCRHPHSFAQSSYVMSLRLGCVHLYVFLILYIRLNTSSSFNLTGKNFCVSFLDWGEHSCSSSLTTGLSLHFLSTKSVCHLSKMTWKYVSVQYHCSTMGCKSPHLCFSWVVDLHILAGGLGCKYKRQTFHLSENRTVTTFSNKILVLCHISMTTKIGTVCLV